MNRRNAIKSLGLLTGGMMLMPSCSFLDKRTPIVLNKLKITEDEEILFEEIVDTMLPETDTPGGVSLKIQNFVWVMLDDCADKEKQDTFLRGLRLFNPTVKEKYGDEFSDFNAEEKLTTLQQLFKDESLNEDLVAFLHTTKQTAVWGYKNSEYYMTNLMPYKLVPGSFSYKTKTINASDKININA
ncbi:gluconate 2-dehydrogenase subunit 3 family protein [Joostella atrarenae]|uniref:Gluconate 2-dehydrogenase subunit 3 family protein n=1 Tax=Joostella atrarenae TaxID=679257 RepID=A0ABS9IZP6_9FLAO|nr:gluconate 2-dehydrogenase subunit 3 family protein [Joostella atrarenae]MCF8713651.1 gluconate 2-dehydrogenase subunit 3 family protein [Joostella atrarenae]